jgi:hypothetical protein
MKLKEEPCKFVRQHQEDGICAQLASISIPDFVVIKGIKCPVLAPISQQCVHDMTADLSNGINNNESNLHNQ